ncbi:MAG TPA: M20 family metallopeptidase [Chloroflexia bacterium]|nr:M20 family metallopeptidase [Chloroflexia bacterium]
MQSLLAALTARTDTIVADLMEWCACESPSSDGVATSRMAAIVALHMGNHGADVTLLPGERHGALVRASWPGPAGAAPVLLLGHHDTVHPLGSLARNPVRVEDGRLYAPGSYDMKGGLLLAVAALATLTADGHTLPRPVVFISTADEEVGSLDSRALIEETARGAAAVLVLEPAARNGALKTARKGTGMYTVVARGQASHAGVDHTAGISAITELAHQVIALAGLTNYANGVTVNVGQVQGGTATNTVAAEATALIDVRVPTDGDARRLDAAILSLQPVLPGAKLEVTGYMDRPPMERNPGTVRLFELAHRLGAEIGLDLQEIATGGASDGNLTAALGVPTLDGLGVCGDGAHTDHEWVSIADIAPRGAVLAGLLSHL